MELQQRCISCLMQDTGEKTKKMAAFDISVGPASPIVTGENWELQLKLRVMDFQPHKCCIPQVTVVIFLQPRQ